jgi:hypothetical protein
LVCLRGSRSVWQILLSDDRRLKASVRFHKGEVEAMVQIRVIGCLMLLLGLSALVNSFDSHKVDSRQQRGLSAELHQVAFAQDKIKAVATRKARVAKIAKQEEKTESKDAKETAVEEHSDPMFKSGILKDAAEPLGKVMKLVPKSGRLSVEAIKDYQASYQAMQEFQQSIGGYGGSSSNGQNRWMQTINGQKVHGQIGRGSYPFNYQEDQKLKEEDVPVYLRLQENESPRRSIQFSATEAGDVSITLTSEEAPYRMRLVQQRSGQILVQEMSENKVFCQQAESFDSLCMLHSEFVQDRLLPALGSFGLVQPMTRYIS